jgi:hypothetical protein
MSTPRGKIGRLPVVLRNQVNAMIRDNKQAPTILAFLAEHDIKNVSPQNLSSWKAHGYQHWERRMHRLDAMQARREFAQTLVRTAAADGTDDLNLASNAAGFLAVDAIQDVLEDFDPENLKELLAEKPDKFMGLVDVLNGLRKGDVAVANLQMKIREARSALEQARRRAEAEGNTDLADLANQMDKILGG